MALFKIAVKYIGKSAEDIIEIEAKNPIEAKKKCSIIMDENQVLIEHLSRFNVYTSKILESCRLCSYDYKLDILSLEELLDSKDNV